MQMTVLQKILQLAKARAAVFRTTHVTPRFWISLEHVPASPGMFALSVDPVLVWTRGSLRKVTAFRASDRIQVWFRWYTKGRRTSGHFITGHTHSDNIDTTQVHSLSCSVWCQDFVSRSRSLLPTIEYTCSSVFINLCSLPGCMREWLTMSGTPDSSLDTLENKLRTLHLSEGQIRHSLTEPILKEILPGSVGIKLKTCIGITSKNFQAAEFLLLFDF